MNQFREFADDYYVNMNLATVMDLSCSRENRFALFRSNQQAFSCNAEFLPARQRKLHSGTRERAMVNTIGVHSNHVVFVLVA